MSRHRPSTVLSGAAKLVAQRIHALSSRRSQLEIATAAGFKTPNVLSMIKDGTTKLPIDRVEALSKALECDPKRLMRLALEQFYSAEVLRSIEAAASTSAAPDALDGIGPDDESIPLPRDPEVVRLTAVAIGVELLLAQRELKFVRQFVQNAAASADSINERLVRIRREVDALAGSGPEPTEL